MFFAGRDFEALWEMERRKNVNINLLGAYHACGYVYYSPAMGRTSLKQIEAVRATLPVIFWQLMQWQNVS